MKPYYDDGHGIKIYHGDCLEILPEITAENKFDIAADRLRQSIFAF